MIEADAEMSSFVKEMELQGAGMWSVLADGSVGFTLAFSDAID
jgi:hypothetical protein